VQDSRYETNSKIHKIIRLGNTEILLLFIEWLKKSGLATHPADDQIYLSYAWSTMGWYDKRTQIPANKETLEWAQYYTQYLEEYMGQYRTAIINSDIAILLKCTRDALNRVASRVKNDALLHPIEHYVDTFISNLSIREIWQSFNWKQVYPIIQGHSVMVISPFADLFKSQYELGNAGIISPSFKPSAITFVPYPYCFNNKGPHLLTHETIDQWIDDHAEKAKDHTCIIAAIGASGPIILNRISNQSQLVIYSGGDLQLQFGVGGSRWRDLILSSSSYQKHPEAWILSVPENLRPSGYLNVEEGCYW
jgi:hypothetical protein